MIAFCKLNRKLPAAILQVHNLWLKKDLQHVRMTALIWTGTWNPSKSKKTLFHITNISVIRTKYRLRHRIRTSGCADVEWRLIFEHRMEERLRFWSSKSIPNKIIGKRPAVLDSQGTMRYIIRIRQLRWLLHTRRKCSAQFEWLTYLCC